jgi:hypothetical protein
VSFPLSFSCRVTPAARSQRYGAHPPDPLPPGCLSAAIGKQKRVVFTLSAKRDGNPESVPNCSSH